MSDSKKADSLGNIENLFIGIAGIIGAGKTTLAKTLGEHLGIDVYYEPVKDNEYLDDFYRDTPRYSFAMQVYLLTRRFRQHQEIIWRGRPAVQDRTIYEDSVFAKMLSDAGLMEPRDYRTYVELFRQMSNFMCKPNVIIYLDVDPETSFERVQERRRQAEKGITKEYLKALYAEYENFVRDISRLIPLIRVSWNQYRDVEEMAQVIKREYLDHSFVRQVKEWRYNP